LAYETLSEGLRKTLDGLVGVNTSAKAEISRTREDRLREAGAELRGLVGAHPVVRTHPETGRRAPYGHARPTHPFPGCAVGVGAGGDPASPRLPVRASGRPGVPLPFPLAARLPRLLGQPLRPAQPRQRLPRIPPGHASGDAGGRPAAVSGATTVRCWRSRLS